VTPRPRPASRTAWRVGLVHPAFDEVWAASVCKICDPVFESADVGFVRRVLRSETGLISALLWEADPQRFVERSPDSGLLECP
jgi:hypothetical protein